MQKGNDSWVRPRNQSLASGGRDRGEAKPEKVNRTISETASDTTLKPAKPYAPHSQGSLGHVLRNSQGSMVWFLNRMGEVDGEISPKKSGTKT